MDTSAEGKDRRGRLREELERLAPSQQPVDASAAFLSSVLAHIPAMVCAVAPDGRLLFVNRVIPGLTMEEVLGKSVYDVTSEENHAAARAAFARVMETGEPNRYIGHGEGKMGPRSRHENLIGPIRAGDEVIAMTLITRDVSVESEVMRQLQDREARLRIALEASGMGMYRFDLASGRTELDERVRAIYGVETDHFEPGDEAEFIHPEDLPALRAAARRCMGHGEAYRVENRIRRADGSEGWVAGHGTQLRDDDGQLEGMLGTLVDITEQRKLEDQVRRAQKLEAVGQLTAGIAHNFNNMLAVIVPSLDLVAADVSPKNAHFLAAASEAASRATQMVRELLTYAGKSRNRARTTEDLGAILERTVRICRTTFARAIRIDLRRAEALPPVEIDPAQIEQALMNILLNARDALQEAGTEGPSIVATVDAPEGEAPPDPMEVRGAEPARPEAWVRVVISDNGPGLSPEAQEHAFEPFFTTKEIGQGTGLGLSTSYAIIQKHGGILLSKPNERGAGASFTIWLPAATSALEPTSEVPHPPAALPSRARVLLVDDEEVVRRVVTQVLQHGGYEVRQAATGEHALALLTEDAQVDLIIFDLNMPGMPWRQLVTRMVRIVPTAKRMVFTGQPLYEDIAGVDRVLQKPIGGEELLSAVAEVLSDTR